MSLADEIYQHSLTLPDEAAREALDFIEFLEQRYGKKATSAPKPETGNGEQWKKQLASMPNVGSDEDFVRQKDFGRDVSWDI